MAENIEWVITEESIEWKMDWSEEDQLKHGRPADELVFEKDKALAHLLLNDVVFVNNHWWKKDLPEKFKESISVNVNCSDVFAWACADAEELPKKEIETLYRMWRKDPVWGPSVWCMIQRKKMPQPPVEMVIRELGIWDLDTLKLAPNT